MKYLLTQDAHWNQFVDNIGMLFAKYESVQIGTMGFQENWKEVCPNK